MHVTTISREVPKGRLDVSRHISAAWDQRCRTEVVNFLIAIIRAVTAEQLNKSRDIDCTTMWSAYR